LETVSIGTPLVRVVVVANVCRAIWKVSLLTPGKYPFTPIYSAGNFGALELFDIGIGQTRVAAKEENIANLADSFYLKVLFPDGL
jgi:hypothetical protein